MSKSRAAILVERIKDALKGNKLQTSEINVHLVEDSSFGPVKIVMFLWSVADNDINADIVAQEVLFHLKDDDIYVSFHKTRRRDGERLLTVTQPLEPNNPKYSYGNLRGFTSLWLIQATGAEKLKQARDGQGNDGRIIRR
ncbi:hypothetical protein RYR28_002786 [Edwardsiella piscicida]|uniref:Uncharacterized protein n=6 Tax=Edwardsiella TaxID=635 RepID=A0A0H3DW18_EDWTF|nr:MULTISPECIES: hypothetical protein [Edwardsiella]ACY85849.1 hypothetical protein ETAE_3016 [Edwardsiella tarda EIB202]ADM42848.1 hypothetical protein ETAF_2744 [Edwardsiella tarda FL6-60]AKM46828.1 hypothetical protein QY76_05280 [Edwardsiella sp. EA181011]AGH75026.1 hypothetical protein ETAC_14525 [Edwardsiella piscicida C07-087]AIJ07708.1 Hypothetical protein ETEE_1250 [Edwardsiella anguillarum ET080813]